MRKFAQKTVAAGVLSIASVASPSVYAYGCPPFNDAIVVAKTMAMEAALKSLWSSMFNSLAKMLLGYDRQEISSIKVMTSQITTAARAEIKAQESISKGRMSALAYLDSIKHQAKVFQQYSPQTGQGVDPCSQLNAQQVLRVADTAGAIMARNWAKSMPSAPGRFGDAATYYKDRQERRKALYATADEEKLGHGKRQKDFVVLTTGERFQLAGADTNAAVLFADTSDPRVIQAKKDFIINMAGPPDSALSKSQSNAPAAKEYLLAKGRKDALMSAAVNSLTEIAAENTPVSHGGKSKNHAFREMRDLYYGANAAQRWAAWATQDIRGLRMDQMRLDAATMAAKEEIYKSGQRLELLLGAMLVAKVGNTGGVLDSQVGDLMDRRLKSPVD